MADERCNIMKARKCPLPKESRSFDLDVALILDLDSLVPCA